MYYFIVNPHSRSGMGEKLWNEIQPELDKKDIDYKVYFTRYQKHATKIVRELTHEKKLLTIIVLGGDGTINEVVNGIQHSGLVTLGYIPTGSSNDFARSYHLPSKPVKALEAILSPKCIRSMDLGEVSYGKKKRRFAVSSGSGFDAAICQQVDISKIKYFLNRMRLGKLIYVLTALRQWMFMSPSPVTITLDGKESHTFDNCYFVTTMNHKYEGGGFMFAPKAKPDDGELSICVIADISKIKMLLLLPTALWGKHTLFKGVYTYHCKNIHISSEEILPLHVDGEPISEEKEITLTCLPSKIQVITTK